MAGGLVLENYACEVPFSTEWAFGRIEPPFRPNVFADMTETISSELDAMEAYRGESGPRPDPRSSEALRALARH